MQAPKSSLKIADLLNYFPSSVWESLAQEYAVDKHVKKLKGKDVCLLVLYAMFQGKTTSLRTLETYYGSSVFQTYAGIRQGSQIDHSSIADRLTRLQGSYVKALFSHVQQQLLQRYPSQKINGYELIRFDSTLLSISAKLLSKDETGTPLIGMKNGSKGKVSGKEVLSVKFTVGFDGLYTRVGELFTLGNYIPENKALAEVVEGYSYTKGQIAVFDRGISRRKTYQQLCSAGVIFVTRINPSAKKELIKEIDLQNQQDATLIYHQDQWVYLFNSDTKVTTPLRIIQTTSQETGKPLCFLTNSTDLTPQEIAMIYQRRWDIECFFKFLKQELGIRHFLVRNETGLMTVLYLALIAAMLIYIYKIENKKSSYKIAKIAFHIELEEFIIELIVQEKIKEKLTKQYNPKE